MVKCQVCGEEIGNAIFCEIADLKFLLKKRIKKKRL